MQTNSTVAGWAGIDVSKEWVDVAVWRGERRIDVGRFARDKKGLGKMAKQLVQYAPEAVALEATGGYEVAVMAALTEACIAVVRLNPRRVRDFARAQGLLAKTDKIDAYVLALFGVRMRPAIRALPEPERVQLANWETRRQQVVEMRATERTRLQQVKHPELRKSLERTIAFLGKELARLDAQIDKCLQESQQLVEQAALLDTAPGVGPRTACVLTARVPELGAANRREIAALAGLAPIAQDSGKYQGKRRIQGGRAPVRAALYIAAWSATRVAGKLRDYYHHLIAQGKPRQLALIAVARKLLIALNEMMRKRQPWTENADFSA